ncbi:MAG TPA: DivIVA domain-containing protein [Candidatus Limnocylindrales bacterium]
MSSSHGQRFRRRAVRRGYKVDEVDQFLDRVEATLNGTPMGAPVSAQDVHEVVFRVRFGGYDEWQVDLHLDRVERQIAELEERSSPGVGAQLRASMAPPPMMMDRSGGPPPPLPTRTPNASAPTSTIPRYDQQSFEPPRRDEGSFANSGSFQGLADHPSGSFPGFGPPPDRNSRPDITGEIRPQRSDPYGTGGYGAVAPDPYAQPARGGYDPGATGAFNAVPAGYGPPSSGGGGGAESQRVDQLRRTFQLRRFGSGYDPGQVDRLFDNVLGALSGRGGVNEAELDPSRLNLVPGGYYEAEVDQAIREVREILRAR